MSRSMDPGVFELLGEISRDKDSRLMKLARAGFGPPHVLRSRAISARESLFTRAERHLLSEYREEVAFLLFKACQREVMSLPSERSMIYRKAGSGFEVVIPPPEWWRAEGQRIQRSRARAEVRRSQDLLGADLTTARVEASALASASLAIWPRDETRIWLALALFAEGDIATGKHVLQDVLAHHPSDSNESYARQGMGWEALEQGDGERAVSEYRRAFEKGADRVNPLLAWLHAALASCDRASVLTSAGLLAEIRRADIEAFIDDHVGLWTRQLESGAFKPSSGARDLASAIAGDLPDPARRIAAVFLGVTSGDKNRGR